MKIDILGTEYEIIETSDTETDELKNADGYCNGYRRYILVEKDLFRDDKKATDEDKELRKRLVLKHEIIHAFCWESGLMDSYINDEWAVTWLATQFPKILKAFQEVGAI